MNVHDSSTERETSGFRLANELLKYANLPIARRRFAQEVQRAAASSTGTTALLAPAEAKQFTSPQLGPQNPER